MGCVIWRKHLAETSSQPTSPSPSGLSRESHRKYGSTLADSAATSLPGLSHRHAHMLNMTTRADMSVVRRTSTFPVQSSCMNAIAYGGGSGYAIWRGEILLRAGAAPSATEVPRTRYWVLSRRGTVEISAIIARDNVTSEREVERQRQCGSTERTIAPCAPKFTRRYGCPLGRRIRTGEARRGAVHGEFHS